MPWPTTKITRLLGIHLPIIQAPMAGISTPELVAAISNAGGLGSLACGYMQPDDMQTIIKETRALTDKPFAVNLFIPNHHHATEKQMQTAHDIVQAACAELNFVLPAIKPPFAPSFDAQMQMLLEEQIPIFSFTFGVLSEAWVKMLKQKNIILIGTATNLEEAKQLKASNIDVIVAQGIEAGGHRGTFIGTVDMSQLSVAHLLSDFSNINVPLIATGGIMTGEDILSMLALGAQAVQMGTVFLCCEESSAHPAIKTLLLRGMAIDTVLTRAFSGRCARSLKNAFIEKMKLHEDAILDYPIQNALTTQMRKEAAKQNNTNFMSLFAGENYAKCKAIAAAQIIQSLNPPSQCPNSSR